MESDSEKTGLVDDAVVSSNSLDRFLNRRSADTRRYVEHYLAQQELYAFMVELHRSLVEN